MFKKLVSIAILVSSFSLQANHTKGFFLGVGAGGRLVSNKLEYINDSGNKGKFIKKEMGLSVNLHGGYLRQLQDSKVVIGGEIFYQTHSYSAKKQLVYDDQSADGNFKITHKMTFGGNLITGAFVNPVVIMYAKAGYAITRMQMDFTNLTGDSPNYDKYNKIAKGPLVGAGIKYLLTKKIILSGEYSMHIIDEVEPRKASESKNGTKRGFKYNVTANNFEFKISYLF
jgi:hypothetical protein